jgi:enoyl-CoA hydratase/carnithine racemase
MNSINFEQINRWGVITLQKPETLNALDLHMVLGIRSFLKDARNNPNVSGIIIKSAVPKIFCAGGDIKAVYRWHTENDVESLHTYIHEEYALNADIQSFPKPVVAMMNGLTLGGGVGLSRYATYRIATTEAVVGMPEVKIAFFPDVGAGYFLNLLDQPLARFLALTGYLLKGSDLITVGYATHLISANETENLLTEILSTEQNRLDAVLPVSETTPSALAKLAPMIQCFKANSLIECMEALTSCDHPEASKVYQEMLTFSPLSLHIIWQYMNITKGLNYASVLQVDLNLARRMFNNSDLFEGIRTRLIDKGDKPSWRHDPLQSASDDLWTL